MALLRTTTPFRCSELIKNAFAIRHLLHYSKVYTFTQNHTIMIQWMHFFSFLGNYLLGTQKYFLAPMVPWKGRQNLQLPGINGNSRHYQSSKS